MLELECQRGNPEAIYCSGISTWAGTRFFSGNDERLVVARATMSLNGFHSRRATQKHGRDRQALLDQWLEKELEPDNCENEYKKYLYMRTEEQC